MWVYLVKKVNGDFKEWSNRKLVAVDSDNILSYSNVFFLNFRPVTWNNKHGKKIMTPVLASSYYSFQIIVKKVNSNTN